MKITAFVYDFPHAKSCNGLLAMAAAGFNDVTCIAAPKKTLNIRESKTRVAPSIKPLHPYDVAKALGFSYIQHEHDQFPSAILMRSDVAVILGARVLKEWVTKLCPIINMHPGLLPYNRGLDNLKWAILDRIPQAVSTHIIDKEIDRGMLLDRKLVMVNIGDTLIDVHLRLKEVEIQMMIEALRRLEQTGDMTKIRAGDLGIRLPEGRYYKAVPDYLDYTVMSALTPYQIHYNDICRDFFKRNPEALCSESIDPHPDMGPSRNRKKSDKSQSLHGGNKPS